MPLLHFRFPHNVARRAYRYVSCSRDIVDFLSMEKPQSYFLGVSILDPQSAVACDMTQKRSFCHLEYR